jgi:hypothetical protein
MKDELKEAESEISLLRSNLYMLLDGENSDKNTILKVSIALDRAILKYMKSIKH